MSIRSINSGGGSGGGRLSSGGRLSNVNISPSIKYESVWTDSKGTTTTKIWSINGPVSILSKDKNGKPIFVRNYAINRKSFTDKYVLENNFINVIEYIGGLKVSEKTCLDLKCQKITRSRNFEFGLLSYEKITNEPVVITTKYYEDLGFVKYKLIKAQDIFISVHVFYKNIFSDVGNFKENNSVFTIKISDDGRKLIKNGPEIKFYDSEFNRKHELVMWYNNEIKYIKYYYNNDYNNISSVAHFKNDKLNGLNISYHANEKIYQIANFVNNLKHGAEYLYDMRGYVMHEIIWKYGEIISNNLIIKNKSPTRNLRGDNGQVNSFYPNISDTYNVHEVFP